MLKLLAHWRRIPVPDKQLTTSNAMLPGQEGPFGDLGCADRDREVRARARAGAYTENPFLCQAVAWQSAGGRPGPFNIDNRAPAIILRAHPPTPRTYIWRRARTSSRPPVLRVKTKN